MFDALHAITIDEAIEQLQTARAKSKLGGGTCLVVTLMESGVPDMNLNCFQLVEDQDGAVVEAQVHAEWVKGLGDLKVES